MDKITTPTISQIQIGNTVYDLVDKYSKETLFHSIIKRNYNLDNIQEWIEIDSQLDGLKNKIDYHSIRMTDAEVIDQNNIMNTPYFEVGTNDNNTIKALTFGKRLSFGPERTGERLAIGNYSVVEGQGAATAEYAFAMGKDTVAHGEHSHAEGENTRTEADAIGSHSEGKESKTEGAYSHAEGISTIASGEASHAEGFKTVASGNYSHAEGGTGKSGYTYIDIILVPILDQELDENEKPVYKDVYDENGEIVIDPETGEPVQEPSMIITGYEEVPVEGSGEDFNVPIQTEARGDFSHAEGFVTHAEGKNSHSEGAYTIATGKYSHAEGGGYAIRIDNSDLPDSSAGESSSDLESTDPEATEQTDDLEEGDQGDDSGSSEPEGGEASYDPVEDESLPDYKFQIISTEAIGHASHAEGFATQAIGDHSHSEGSETKAEGRASHTEGENTQTFGDNCHAEGYRSIATGDFSHVEGRDNYVEGSAGHAEGWSTKALGKTSHAEGYNTTAEKDFSHAEGCGTYANGKYSHAEGYSTQATNTASHAEGYLSEATEIYSHAERYSSKASGKYSHAEGYLSEASGYCSHAQNANTIAKGDYQTVIGKLNKIDSSDTHAFIIGNGTPESMYFDTWGEGFLEEEKRANAFTVGWNGETSLISKNLDRENPPDSTTTGTARLCFRDLNDQVISRIYPQLLLDGRSQLVLNSYNFDGTQSNYLAIGCEANGTPRYLVKDKTAFRTAIASYTTTDWADYYNQGILNPNDGGSLKTIDNCFSASFYIGGKQLVSPLENGQSTGVILTLESRLRPHMATYAPIVISTNGVPNGVFLSITTAGDVKIFNRTGTTLPTSYKMYATATYTI